jgi:hypothetical protein
VQHQPTDFPVPQEGATGCAEVVGTYVDPNARRDEHIQYLSELAWSEEGGAIDMAWHAFGFGGMGISDAVHHQREFTIRFDSENAMVIDYTIDGAVVGSKRVLPSEYSCKQGVLGFVTYHREGERVYDMLPNVGSLTDRAEISRSGDFLYVKWSSEAHAVFYGFIPTNSEVFEWSRFPSTVPARIPTVPPSRSFRWDISKKDSLIELDFVVTEHRLYEFDIDFNNWQPTDALRAFIGTTEFDTAGRELYFTKDPIQPARVRAQDVGGVDRLEELYRKGEVLKKERLPGVIVPVHIQVERVDGTPGSARRIIDEIVNTEGITGGGDHVRSRRIATIHLEPGQYRVRATTLMEVPLPAAPGTGLYTALGIHYDSSVVPSKN